jgi:cobalt/nickel transport system permease protein
MHFVDRIAHGNRWTARHPADKLVLGGSLLVLSLLLPPLPGAPLILAAAVLAMTVGAGIPVADCARAMLLPASFLAVSGVVLSLSLHVDNGWPALAVSEQGAALALQTSVRALAATSALLLVVLTTPLTDLLGLMRRRGLPAAIVDLILLVYRLSGLAIETASALRTAQTNRLGYRDVSRSIRSSGMLAAALVPLLLDRSARLHAGLAARAYQGDLRVLEPPYAPSRRFLALSLLLAFGLAAVTGGFALAGWAGR